MEKEQELKVWRKSVADKIIRALWESSKKAEDVTEIVKAKIMDGDNRIVHIMWLGDPDPNIPKILEIQIKNGERIELIVVEEGKRIPDTYFNRQSRNPQNDSKAKAGGTKTERCKALVPEMLLTIGDGSGLMAKEIHEKLEVDDRLQESSLRKYVLQPLVKSGKITLKPGVGYQASQSLRDKRRT